MKHEILSKNLRIYEELDPKVSVKDNFGSLLIPKDHPSRSKNDTYYIDEKTVLRTHTTAHQNMLLKKGETAFLVTEPVFRRDKIDKNHHSIFSSNG